MMTKQYLGFVSIGRMELGKKVLFNSTSNIENIFAAIKEAITQVDEENTNVLKEHLQEDAETVSNTITENIALLNQTVEFLLANENLLENFYSEGLTHAKENGNFKEALEIELYESDLLYCLLFDLTFGQVEKTKLSFEESEEDVILLIQNHIQDETQKTLRLSMVNQILMKDGSKIYGEFDEEKKKLISFITKLDSTGLLFKTLFNSTIYDPSMSKQGTFVVIPNNKVIVVD